MVIKTNPTRRGVSRQILAATEWVKQTLRNKVLKLLKINNFSYMIKIMSTTAIQRAINIAGTQQNLAALANLTQPAIHFLACGRNGRACFPRYQTAKKLSDAVGGVIAWHEFMEQGATQETPHGTEAPAAGSSNTAEIAALESGAATESSAQKPIEH